jgi:hypothetical protein
MVTSAKGLVIKTSRGRGNVVENIRFQNITMRSTLLYGIYLNMFYQRKPPVEPRLTPKFRNIVFHQISGTGINAGQFLCLPESPCEGIHLVDVKMESLIGWKCENAGGSTRNVFPDPCIRNSTGSLTKYVYLFLLVEPSCLEIVFENLHGMIAEVSLMYCSYPGLLSMDRLSIRGTLT